ncbi:glycosyltransferase [Arthrobacter burdickii]|uniref:Glycosyltransferase n=1 Tax=Arthrobacter burdickii TaxID=3035920 RepID=A0ABT8K8C8_9MICC|nr:glycosyltransferase [Arthrobacter burdickii]MDN4612584.1 glycosyltransferase [Arthrobacter burdickii]
MRILRVVVLLSKTGKYGGPADTALAQARLAASAGNEVAVLGGFLKGDDLVPQEISGVRIRTELVRPLVPKVFFPTLFSLRIARALVGEIRRADVVHVSISREAVSLLAAWMTLIARKPLVLQPHGMLTARAFGLSRLLDFLIKPLMHMAAEGISLTHVEQSALARLYGQEMKNFSTIGNPLVAALPPSGAASEPHFSAIFIARLHERKRIRDFVGAALWSADQGWPDRYHFAGPDQGELEEVQAHVEALPTLSYGGVLSRQAIPEALLNARVFVLCSSNEPWGNVLVLALSLGIPCVVTRSTALAQDIEAAGAGIIVDDGSSEQIARAVHAIASSPERWSQLNAGALALAERRFSDSGVREQLLATYSAAVRGRTDIS